MLSCLLAGSTTGQELLRNGSFEQSQSLPGVEVVVSHGRSGANGAHGGEQFVSSHSKKGEVVWRSETIQLQTQTDYRIEGWVRCQKGQTLLAIECLDGDGKVIDRETTPPLLQADAWQHTAREWNSRNATAARACFWVKGQADLDDVSLTPVARSFIANKIVEGDARGRISFWGEEKDDALMPGRRAGTNRLDKEVRRLSGTPGETNLTSLQLKPAGDWYAVSSVNYPVAVWTDRMEFSGWARCDGAATATILACWMDDMQKVLRVDSSEPHSGKDWQRIVLSAGVPPQAFTVRLVAVARGGSVWFDDFELLRLRPREPQVRVFVNQIGYEKEGPKSAIVAANFFPSDSNAATIELLTPKGKIAWRGKAASSGRIYGDRPDDWGWYFWRADFSELRKAGTYHVVARVGRERGESFPFKVDQDLLPRETAQNSVDFFFIQRCGFEVPGWHKACHLDDAKLPDGTHLEVTGGWHSAGDYNKLMYENGDGGVAFALLSAYDARPGVFQRFDRDSNGSPDALDEAMWGAQFVAKMQIPESGGLRNHVNQGPGRNWMKWSAPEVHTDNVVGTEDDPVITPGAGNSPLVIGAWARLSVLLKLRGVTNDYLHKAVRLWNHATKDGTQAGSPHLLLSALELHRVTSEPAYLEHARRNAESLLSQQVTSGRLRGAFGSYGELTAGALAQFALAHPDDPLRTKITQALQDFVTFCVGAADNPFGVCKTSVGATENYLPADLGNNFQLLQRAWAAGLAYQVTSDPRASSYATDQIDWILGKNPLNLCLFEGKGTVNPPRYHHRYNSIPGQERGAVPGTIPNGFVRDMGLADRPGFDLSRGGNRSPSFRTSEPWLVHNMWYLLALSALPRSASH